MQNSTKRAQTKTLSDIQKELGEWATTNFGKRRTEELRLIGMSEEIGELVTQVLEMVVPVLHLVRENGVLSHSHLKEKCGIRGTPEQHQAKARDAIGDIFLFMADYCNLRGWSVEEIIQTTWDEVKQRNWIDDPQGGLKRYDGQSKEYVP